MIMNNKNRVFGTVESVEENKDYIGLETDTAKVTVNNTDRTISVDVDARYNLGETPDTAYPGDKGAETRRLAVGLLNTLDAETIRSKDADRELTTRIQAVKKDVDNIKLDYASKLYVAEKIAESNTVSKVVADDVDEENNKVIISGVTTDPKDTVIYLVKDEYSEGYRQYTVIDGKLTLIGTTNVDLSQYATKTYVNESISKIDFSPYATKEEIPDVSSFITEVPEEYITETELVAKGYLTEHQDLSDYATKTYVQAEISKIETVKKVVVDGVNLEENTVLNNGEYEPAVDGVIYLVKDDDSEAYSQYMLLDNRLTLIGTTDVDLSQYATLDYVDEKFNEIPQPDLSEYAKKEDIPDVSSFIAEIPEEYITETELKGTLLPLETSSKDLSEQLNKFITEFNSIEFIDGGTSSQFK